MQRARVREAPDQTMQRFLSGLQFKIKSIVRHVQYNDMTELLHQAREAEKRLAEDPKLFKKAQGRKIAIMGCVVNGPGEAKDADFGVAGGKGVGAFIQNGKVTKNLTEADWVQVLVDQINKEETPGEKSKRWKR